MLTVKEAAERLTITRAAVYELIRAGRLIAHRLGPKGGSIRVDEEEITRYVQSTRTGGEEGGR